MRTSVLTDTLNKKIPLSQNTIILISLLFLLAGSSLLFLFAYAPSKTRLNKIRYELIEAENQLKQINSLIGKNKTAAEALEFLKLKYDSLRAKLPPAEQESLSELYGSARKLNIDVISVIPAAASNLLDSNNRIIEIEGKPLQVMPVAMEITCVYKNLVRLIQILNESFSVFLTIEDLRILKDKSGTGKLNVRLELNIYLLS